MKQMKMKVLYLVLIVLSGLSVVSCKKSSNNTDEGLTANLFKSSNKYRALVGKRQATAGAFDIEGITRLGNMLTISVKGGCNENDFKLVWDGAIMLSNPGQVNLVLYNDAQEACGGGNRYVVNADLAKALGAYGAGSLIVNVANASKIQDLSLHTNGSVTRK